MLRRRKRTGSLEGMWSFVARIPIERRPLWFVRMFLPLGSCQSPFVFAAGISGIHRNTHLHKQPSKSAVFCKARKHFEGLILSIFDFRKTSNLVRFRLGIRTRLCPRGRWAQPQVLEFKGLWNTTLRLKSCFSFQTHARSPRQAATGVVPSKFSFYVGSAHFGK